MNKLTECLSNRFLIHKLEKCCMLSLMLLFMDPVFLHETKQFYGINIHLSLPNTLPFMSKCFQQSSIVKNQRANMAIKVSIITRLEQIYGQRSNTNSFFRCSQFLRCFLCTASFFFSEPISISIFPLIVSWIFTFIVLPFFCLCM